MTVYILFNGEAYEDSTVVGIFFTREAAEKRLIEHRKTNLYGPRDYMIESHEVE